MKRLAILGASGHGKVIADTALLLGWEEIVFFDDAWPDKVTNGHWPVMGKSEGLLGELDQFQGVVVGIGDCRIRWHNHQLLREANAPLVSIIHPKAFVSSYAKIGTGSVLFGGAIVNVDAVVGEACVINTGAIVDHDCVISDAVHIAPGAHVSGDVMVAERSWIGVGSAVRQGIHVGSDVVVGAGAVVVKNIADSVTVVGNPARVLGDS